MQNEYSVCQFFPDESYEYAGRWMSTEEALQLFRACISGVDAASGLVHRVILTDGGDSINMEWQHGLGIVFPPPEGAARA